MIALKRRDADLIWDNRDVPSDTKAHSTHLIGAAYEEDRVDLVYEPMEFHILYSNRLPNH